VAHSSFRLQRITALVSVSVISLAGWGYLLHESGLMSGPAMGQAWMPPSPPQPWSHGDFIMAFLMWSVMMAAMMIPSILPMLLGFLKIRQRAAENHRHPYLGAWGFLLGYFLIWIAFCAVMSGVQWQLHVHGLLSPMMESQSMLFSGSVLFVVGIYQFTPWKVACLAHCRKPDDLGDACHRNAVAVGSHHGLNCLGSCWALMVMMLAVGVMSLTWMGILTGAVTLEKALPWNPDWLRLGSGVALLGWGGWLIGFVGCSQYGMALVAYFC
jgi:predicted metal-binding membrane protein